MGSVCTRSRWLFFFVFVIICHNLVSAVMPVGSSVVSVGSVVFPASSLVRDKMCYSIRWDRLPGW